MSSFADGDVYYKRGRFNTSDLTVEYRAQESFGTGEHPKVAMDDNGKILSLVHWDDMLYRGKYLPAIASDDAHTIKIDGGRGWVYVKAAENAPAHPNSHGERYAERYEINMLRCIFCGMCEEACPEDAIFLEKDYELSDYHRDAFIYTKDELVVPMEKSGYLPQR